MPKRTASALCQDIARCPASRMRPAFHMDSLLRETPQRDRLRKVAAALTGCLFLLYECEAIGPCLRLRFV